jgi:hypothetical protein
LPEEDADQIGEEIGWTATDSWKKRGESQTARPSEDLIRSFAAYAW